MTSSYAMIIGVSELENLGLLKKDEITNKRNCIHKLFRNLFSHADSFYRRTLILPSTSQRNRIISVQMSDIHHYNLDMLSDIKIELYKLQLQGDGKLEGRDNECMRLLDTLEQIYELVHERVANDVKEDKNLMISIDKMLIKIAKDERKLIRSHCNLIIQELGISDIKYVSNLLNYIVNRTQIPARFKDFKIKASDEVDTAAALLVMQLSTNKTNPKALTKEVNEKLKKAKKSIANAQQELIQLRESHQPEINALKISLNELNNHMQETVRDAASLKYRIEHELLPKLNPAILDALPVIESPNYIPPEEMSKT